MAGHHTENYLLPTPSPLFPLSATQSLRSAQPQPNNLSKSSTRPLLSLQTPKPLIDPCTPVTSTKLLPPHMHNIRPLLPSPTKIPALMSQASTSVRTNLSKTNRFSQSSITSVCTNQAISTQTRLTSDIKPLIPPQPKPLMSQLPGNYPHNKPGNRPAGVPLMSQFPSHDHPGHYPPPLMQRPPERFSPYPYPSTQAYIPPHKKPGFQQGASFIGHQPPYQSQQWHRGRGQNRGRNFRGRGSGGWRREKPPSDTDAYFDKTMFEDPWKELLNKAGVTEYDKPAISSSRSSDQDKSSHSNAAQPDQEEASKEPCNTEGDS